MTTRELWQRYQDWLYYHQDLDLSLDISRVRFPDDFVRSLEPTFAQAFADMAALEQGAIANPDEGRMVGHYWLRAPDLAPTTQLREEIVESIEQVEAFVRRVHSGSLGAPSGSPFTDLLAIGIGGSALGPQFLADALAPAHPPVTLHFIDNTDPAGIDRVLAPLRSRLHQTMVLVTSKSGGTAETRNGMLEVKHAYVSQGQNFAQHAIAITMAGSHMDALARSEGWLATFPMFDWVGGRTSVMSTVGLLPAALQGIDIRALLTGARDMDIATRRPEVRRNPAALLALSWHWAGEGKGKKDMVVLPYKDSLSIFSRYLQQLVMESLGKEKDASGQLVHQGLTVYGNKGSTDQHAYVQQLREGVPNCFVTFVEVLEDRTGATFEVESGITSGDYLSSFLQGTRQALYDNQRDSITITIPQVNPRTIGALIALYERAVGLYAFLVNINAYHQPGVEAGKKAAAAILALQNRIVQTLQTAQVPLTLAELAESSGAPTEVETVYLIVRHLAANTRHAILHGDHGKPTSLTVTAT